MVVAVRVARAAGAAVTDIAIAVQDWDLSGPQARAAREHPDWSETRLKRAVTGYRHFLFIRSRYPKARIVPHKDVDEIWHAHILHTRDYAAMCEAVLGAFFHHDPSEGGLPSGRDRDDYGATRRLIRHHFGANKDPASWLGNQP